MLRRPTVSLLALACVGLLGTSACNSGTTPPAEAPQTTAAMGERELSAGDTFGVLRAIHGAEADFARLAARKATDPTVRAYAEKLVSAHAPRTQDDHRLMAHLAIEPTDNDVARQLERAAARQAEKLDSMTGIDFDRTYLDEQVSYYRMVLDTITTELLPCANDPRIRTSLTTARERASDQLREAQVLRDAISNDEPAAPAPAPAASAEPTEPVAGSSPAGDVP